MIPTRCLILLVIVCALLFTVMPWWEALAIYCVGHFLFVCLSFKAYRKSVNTAREITGLDFQRAELLYAAALTGDWSKISTDSLRVPVPPDPKLGNQRGAKAKLKRQLIACIIMERTSREVEKESRNMEGRNF